MKQPKRLTLSQKKLIGKLGYDPDNYMFCSENMNELVLWNKEKQVVEAIPKKKS